MHLKKNILPFVKESKHEVTKKVFTHNVVSCDSPWKALLSI